MHYEHQGMRLWVEPDERLTGGAIEPGSDVNLTVGVEPADASNRVQVQYRVNGGPATAIAAEAVRHVGNAQYFKACLPCAALCDGDTVQYTGVCQCAGRQVPSAAKAEEFASSFRVRSAGVTDGNTPASAYATQVNLVSTTALQLNTRHQTVVRETKPLKPTHLSLFVLECNTGHPIARMPFYAEVGVTSFSPPPKPECKLKVKEIILIVFRSWGRGHETYTRMYTTVETNPAATLGTLAELLCDALSRLLTQETIDRMAGDPAYAAAIIRGIFQKATDLAKDKNIDENDPEAERKLIADAIRAYAMDHELPLAGIQTQSERIVWTHPLGVLATDHVGYLSFDLTRLPPDVADAVALALETRRRDPNAPTDTSIWLYPMAREEARIDALAQMRFAPDAIVVKLELDMESDPNSCQPKMCESIKNLGIMAMQNPNLTDWRLSPGSFATNPGTLVGADGCETILPANFAVHEFNFYQVIRLTNLQTAVPADKIEIVSLGVVHEYRLAWYPLGHSLGQILYSLPLAPGETVNLAVIDWTRRDDAQRKEHTTLDEQLVHNEHRDRTISETVNAAVHEYQHGSSFMAGIAGSYGGSYGAGSGGIAGSLGGSTSTSDGSRDVAASTVQKLSDNVTQASAATRELHSTVVVQSTQSEKEAIETRTVVNYNHSHALTILYYEVLRHFRVATELVRRRPAVLVKAKTDWFTETDAAKVEKNVQENRAAIEAALLSPRMGEALNAFERIAHRKKIAAATAPPPGTPPPDPPKGPGARQFRFFTFEMTTGGFVSEKMDDHAMHVDVLSNLIGPELWVDLANADGKTPPFTLNHRGAFREKDAVNRFVALLPPGQQAVAWDSIFGIMIAVFPYKGDEAKVSFKHIKVTAIDTAGAEEVLVDQPYENGHFIVTNEGARFPLPTRRPPPAPAPPGRPAEEIEDDIKKAELLAHLTLHNAYYSRAILLNQNPVERASELYKWGVLDWLDSRQPLEIIGDYMAYPSTNDLFNRRIKTSLKAPPDAAGLPDYSDLPEERLVTLPTRGVFAEAKLGHCNASEEIDENRFWRWDEHPIPHSAPEIAAIQAGKHTVKDVDLKSTPFPQSLVNIVNPPAAPDPTGLAAAMNVLATPNIFRDMSGRAEVAGLLQKLSDNSVSIAQAANQARAIQDKYGSASAAVAPTGGGTAGGGRGGVGVDTMPLTTSGVKPTADELHNDLQLLRNAEMRGDITPEVRQDLATSRLQNAFKIDNATLQFQQFDPHEQLRPWWVTSPLPAADDLTALLADAKALLDAQLQEIGILFVQVSRTTLSENVKQALEVNRVRLSALARRMKSTKTLLSRDWAAAGKSAAEVLSATKAVDALELWGANIEIGDFDLVPAEAHIFDPSAKKQRLVKTPLTNRTTAWGEIMSAYLAANP